MHYYNFLRFSTQSAAMEIQYAHRQKLRASFNPQRPPRPRLFWARFYFVSNAALLDILSNGNDPPKIQVGIRW